MNKRLCTAPNIIVLSRHVNGQRTAASIRSAEWELSAWCLHRVVPIQLLFFQCNFFFGKCPSSGTRSFYKKALTSPRKKDSSPEYGVIRNVKPRAPCYHFREILTRDWDCLTCCKKSGKTKEMQPHALNELPYTVPLHIPITPWECCRAPVYSRQLCPESIYNFNMPCSRCPNTVLKILN